MNPVVALTSLCLITYLANLPEVSRKMASREVRIVIIIFFPRHVTIFSMSFCLSSGFGVRSFRVQDCNMCLYCIAQLSLIVSVVSTNYLVEFIAERKSPAFLMFF